MKQIFLCLDRLADYPSTVLLLGETGTGKELCAKALHYNSEQRKEKKFVSINCAGIPSELLESELFGHMKGAFTGAHTSNSGKFLYADGGTIFLDEIGEMPLHLQTKLLRVIQEKTVTRVGDLKEMPIDVRIIAATHRNLEEEIEKKNFREDLFYRLNVVPITLPPLRERKEDIPLLSEYIIQQLNIKRKSSLSGLSPQAQEELSQKSWKGNIRELENILERTSIWKREGIIEKEDLYFDDKLPNLEIPTTEIPLNTTVIDTTITTPVEPSHNKIVSLEPSVQKSRLYTKPQNTEDTKERWFSKGVVLTAPNTLEQILGTFSKNDIENFLSNSQIYTLRCGTSDNKTPFIYVTQGILDSMFEVRNQEYAMVMQIIHQNPLNEIAKKPFMIRIISEMVENPHFADYYKIKETIKEVNAHTVKSGRSIGVIITQENYPHFMSKKGDPGIVEEMLYEDYKNFCNWQPKKY